MGKILFARDSSMSAAPDFSGIQRAAELEAAARSRKPLVGESQKPQLRQPEIRIRTAAEVGATLPATRWRLRPLIEDDAIIVLFADYGTYKSFQVIDWGMRISLGLPALGHTWPAIPGDASP